MKILVAITYYRPHMSGLTIYAIRLANALASRGHKVTILTSRFSKDLPASEDNNGITIVRAPVMLRISKGVIMPRFGRIAGRLIKEHDVIHLHLPQFDAIRVAFRGWLQRKPVLMTYHCDLHMPKGFINWIVNQVVIVMNNLAALFTDRIVAYTQDYANHSPLLSRFSKKLEVINPPVDLPDVTQAQIRAYGRKYNPDDVHPIIGMAARFATEKGVEVLLNALDKILNSYPRAQVWFAGPYENIMGEQKYYARLKPLLDYYQSHEKWKFIGLLSPRQMALFYPNLDILTIPSLNSTEAFGLIQIEAMMNGVPSIASNLPGVRQPVLRHHMGKVIPIGDANALADAVNQIMQNQEKYSSGWENIARQYAPGTIAKRYETLFQGMIKRK